MDPLKMIEKEGTVSFFFLVYSLNIFHSLLLPFSDSSPRTGIQRYPNGDVYDGNFHSNLRVGRGKFIASANWTYEGDWRNDERSGKGSLGILFLLNSAVDFSLFYSLRIPVFLLMHCSFVPSSASCLPFSLSSLQVFWFFLPVASSLDPG